LLMLRRPFVLFTITLYLKVLLHSPEETRAQWSVQSGLELQLAKRYKLVVAFLGPSSSSSSAINQLRRVRLLTMYLMTLNRRSISLSTLGSATHLYQSSLSSLNHLKWFLLHLCQCLGLMYRRMLRCLASSERGKIWMEAAVAWSD
jgi:hypothetical protein